MSRNDKARVGYPGGHRGDTQRIAQIAASIAALLLGPPLGQKSNGNAHADVPMRAQNQVDPQPKLTPEVSVS